MGNCQAPVAVVAVVVAAPMIIVATAAAPVVAVAGLVRDATARSRRRHGGRDPGWEQDRAPVRVHLPQETEKAVLLPASQLPLLRPLV